MMVDQFRLLAFSRSSICFQTIPVSFLALFFCPVLLSNKAFSSNPESMLDPESYMEHSCIDSTEKQKETSLSHPGTVPQLVKCFPIITGLHPRSQHCINTVYLQSWHLEGKGVKNRSSSYRQLHSKFKASLRHTRLCLQK